MTNHRAVLSLRAAAGVLLLALASCSGAGSGATVEADATADLPAGWSRATVEDEGFSIAVPSGWEEMSSEDLAESGVFEAMASENPAVADTLAQAQAAIESGQIAYFAFDTEPDDTSVAFAANVNVISGGEVDEDDTAESAAEEMADGVESQITVNGEVETDTVTLPAGEAGLVAYEWTVPLPDGTSTDIAVRQYAVLADGEAFVLSFSARADTFSGEYERTFERIAESFATD
jgi:hypothetical protein